MAARRTPSRLPHPLWRRHTLEFIKTRLAILDSILRHLQHDWFEGQAEKVQYFEERVQVRP